MNVADDIAKLKAERQRINDQISTKQAELDDLKARKQQLTADAAELQAFLDWKAVQP